MKSLFALMMAAAIMSIVGVQMETNALPMDVPVMARFFPGKRDHEGGDRDGSWCRGNRQLDPKYALFRAAAWAVPRHVC
jgi:hypothetical protein